MNRFCLTNTKLFNSDEYKDLNKVRAYLYSEHNDEDSSSFEEVDFINSCVEVFSQLRFKAEEKYKYATYSAISKRKELPLSWDDISHTLEFSNKDEPPQHLISDIAQQHIHVVEEIIGNMRRILRRKRTMVHLSSAQQVDAQCLAWLMRQPGRNAAQKAGSRQQILSVMREESFNTLENRVLKDFMHRAILSGKKYLKSFNKKPYQTSDRIKAVGKLIRVFTQHLQSEEMRSISKIKHFPAPNYVLVHDTHYHLIWGFYTQLIKRTRMIEKVWPFRHLLFKDICLLLLTHKLRKDHHGMFHAPIWFRPFPEKGTFTSEASYTNVYKKEHESFFIRELLIDHEYKKETIGFYKNTTNKQTQVKIGYFPEETIVNQYSGIEDIQLEKDCVYFIFNASGKSLKANNLIHWLSSSDNFFQQGFSDF